MTGYLYDPETGAELWPPEADCNGICVMAWEVLEGAQGVAYPHPQCALHGDVDIWPNPAVALAASNRQLEFLTLAYELGLLFTPHRTTNDTGDSK